MGAVRATAKLMNFAPPATSMHLVKDNGQFVGQFNIQVAFSIPVCPYALGH
jgi:hypothetical protein